MVTPAQKLALHAGDLDDDGHDTAGGPGGGGGGDYLEDALAAPIALATGIYGDDACAVTLTAGRWLVLWKSAFSPAGQTSIYGVLWTDDEGTTFDEDETTGSVSGWRYTGPHGWAVIDVATTLDIKTSFSRSNDAAATLLIDGGNSTTGRFTKLTATRLGDL